MKEKSFEEKHPRLYFLIGLILLVGVAVMGVLFAKWVLEIVGNGITGIINYLQNFVNTSDQIVVVAMITGVVSIIGVVISSIVSKIVEYKYNVKRYLYDKREEPYKQFIEMIYRIIENSRKTTRIKYGRTQR